MQKWNKEQDRYDLHNRLRLEEAYIMYGNLFLRSERCLTLLDVQQDELVAVGSYLKGMPFHAFTFHVFDKDMTYSIEGMLECFRVEMGVRANAGVQGVISVSDPCLAQLRITNIVSEQTMLLMKLTNTERLLLAGDSRLVYDLPEAKSLEEMASEVGMVSFRPEELIEMPHMALFSNDGEPLAMAGFHIFEDDFVEIGNIGTSPGHRNKGYGTQITSDICRFALEKTPNVYLCVFSDNPAAIQVYEKLGFATVSQYSFIRFGL